MQIIMLVTIMLQQIFFSPLGLTPTIIYVYVPCDICMYFDKKNIFLCLTRFKYLTPLRPLK